MDSGVQTRNSDVAMRVVRSGYHDAVDVAKDLIDLSCDLGMDTEVPGQAFGSGFYRIYQCTDAHSFRGKRALHVHRSSDRPRSYEAETKWGVNQLILQEILKRSAHLKGCCKREGI